MLRVKFFELFAPIRGDLVFRGRDDRIRVRSKKNSPQSLAGEKARRGAFDAKLFKALAPLALEFLGDKNGVARQIGHQFEEFLREFCEAGGGNRARVRARTGAEASAH